MSKKLLLISLMSLSLLINACQQTSDTTINEATQETPNEATQETPSVETSTNPTSSSSSDETITGIATIGLFGGTEKECEYGDAGSTSECNTGSGTIYLETTEGKIYLKDYSCPALQLYINDKDGKRVEYKASGECDGEIIIGETYTATGELTVNEGVWRNGKQVDEQWLEVESIAQAQ